MRALPTLAVLATSSIAMSGGRGGTYMFWMYVGGALGVARLAGLNDTKQLMAGALGGAYIMSSANYIHPFGPGSNPLKR